MKLTGLTKRIWRQQHLELNRRAEYLGQLWSQWEEEALENNDSYLDVGCGSGENSLCFGRDFKKIYFLDPEPSNIEKCRRNFQLTNEGSAKSAFFLMGDAQTLPFKDEAFDMVSMISLIEHVADQRLAMQEASRVLKNGGQLIVQIPNRYFFLELHSGLPFLYYVPSHRIRRWILEKLGYEGLGSIMNINIPSKNELARLVNSLGFTKIYVSKVVYPPELILPEFRPVYSLLESLKLFNLVPFGWLFVSTRVKNKDM